MQISMKNLEKLSLSEMEDLLNGSRKIAWALPDTEAKYTFITAVLKHQSYSKLGKRERGVVKRFLAKVTATSRAQLTRLITQWMNRRMIERRPAHRPNFAQRYQKSDIVLLAATDAAHEDLSGPALPLQLYFAGPLRRINDLGVRVCRRQNLESATCVPNLYKCNCRTKTPAKCG